MANWIEQLPQRLALLQHGSLHLIKRLKGSATKISYTVYADKKAMLSGTLLRIILEEARGTANPRGVTCLILVTSGTLNISHISHSMLFEWQETIVRSIHSIVTHVQPLVCLREGCGNF